MELKLYEIEYGNGWNRSNLGKKLVMAEGVRSAKKILSERSNVKLGHIGKAIRVPFLQSNDQMQRGLTLLRSDGYHFFIMAKFKKIKANDDGWSEWELPEMEGYRLGCCDCGLVHNVDFKVVRATKIPSGEHECEELDDKMLRVLMRARRNNRSTAQIRRHERNPNEALSSFAQVYDLMRRLHNLNVSTSYAAHTVWDALQSNTSDDTLRQALYLSHGYHQTKHTHISTSGNIMS